MSKKIRVLLIAYTTAALIGLGGLAWGAESRLNWYRQASDLAAARAFEEAVTAADGLSLALKKLAYANDEALGKGLCAQAHADALSCETALTVLPFATQELEELLGFLGRAGDYTASLCTLSAEQLSEQDRQHLSDISDAAAGVADALRQLQGQVHLGAVSMDRRETPIRNIGEDRGELLSMQLLGMEEGFSAPAEFAYEGRFSPAKSREPGTLSESEAKALAAKAAGVEERELRDEYSAEGPEGRRCYSAGGLLVGVSSRGLEYVAQSRLVEGGRLSTDEARQIAERFLGDNGFDKLVKEREGGSESVASFLYVPTQDDAVRVDDGVTISVALDDGSIYAFDATRYDPEPLELDWKTDEDAARKTLPESVTAERARKVILHSPGGNPLPCWELSGTGREGEPVSIYVDAASGRPCKIEL